MQSFVVDIIKIEAANMILASRLSMLVPLQHIDQLLADNVILMVIHVIFQLMTEL